MVGRYTKDHENNLFFQDLESQLNPKHPLYKLSKEIPWEHFEKEFKKYYKNFGRPSKPIRLMVSLLILKQLNNLSDEEVVRRWVENPYWQYFSGMKVFQWEIPCDPTDLIYFRKRIGEQGVKEILKVSIDLHSKDLKTKEVIIDSTVVEKNITYPTDVKLTKKIIDKCNAISKKEGLKLRQSYTRTTKELIQKQRFTRSKKKKKEGLKARRKLKTIAGRLIRDLERKLPADRYEYYKNELELFKQVLLQKRTDKQKIYSLHEPYVKCISKGKESKKYEFGTKASFMITKDKGIIIGALNVGNEYDGKTIEVALKQSEELTGKKIEILIGDRGYKGIKELNGTKIVIPGKRKKISAYEKRKIRNYFRRRASIEPVIGHLKNDYGLSRVYLKGETGDNIAIILSAAAYNFKKYINKLRKNFLHYFFGENFLHFCFNFFS